MSRFNEDEKKKDSRMAGDSGALETFKKDGGKENSAYKGNITKDTPGASAFTKPQFKGKAKDDAPKTRERLNQYDLNATGVRKYDGEQRLSSGDIQNLKRDGYSKSDIIDYASSLNQGKKGKGTEGFVGGVAQKLLSKWTTSLAGKSVTPSGGGGQNMQRSIDVQTSVDSKGGDIRDNQINGSNNNVTYDSSSTVNNVYDINDNSINLQEGDKGDFTYYGGKGGSGLTDDPMSAYTMKQLHDTGDGSDSFGTAKRLALRSGMNTALQNQQNSMRQNHGQNAIKQNLENRADPDPNNLINSMPYAMKDLATTTTANIFGDPAKWRMPKVPTFSTTQIQQDSLKQLEKGKDDDDD